VNPYAFTPDDETIVIGSGGDGNIGTFSVDGDGEPVWLLDEAYAELNADLSFDGRWLVYQSNETGTMEIYIRSFPDLNRRRVQVSNGGGRYPVWARDGRELFYVEPGERVPRLMRVGVTPSGDDLAVGTREALLDWPYFEPQSIGLRGRAYDVSPDGRRFLALRRDATGEAQADVVLIENLATELERLLPGN